MYIAWITAALRLGSIRGGHDTTKSTPAPLWGTLPQGPVYMLAPGAEGETFLSAAAKVGGVGELVSAVDNPIAWEWRPRVKSGSRSGDDVVIVANGTELCLTAPQGRYGATPGDVTLHPCPAASDSAPRQTWVHVGNGRSARLLMRSANLFLGYNGAGSVAATNNYEWGAQWAALE